MAQITTGIRAILSHPLVYDTFQNLLGAKRARTRFANNHLRITPGMRVLDIGCGTAEILDFVPKDIEYTGYDISADYIAYAQKRFADRGTFHARLLTLEEAKTLPPCDVVMAIGVLHHMDDEVVEHFLAIAKAVLKPGGRLVTLDPAYTAGQNPIAKFLIDRDRGQNVRRQEAYEALAHKAFQEVKGTVTHQAWIPYTHFNMECVA